MPLHTASTTTPSTAYITQVKRTAPSITVRQTAAPPTGCRASNNLMPSPATPLGSHYCRSKRGSLGMGGWSRRGTRCRQGRQTGLGTCACQTRRGACRRCSACSGTCRCPGHAPGGTGCRRDSGRCCAPPRHRADGRCGSSSAPAASDSDGSQLHNSPAGLSATHPWSPLHHNIWGHHQVCSKAYNTVIAESLSLLSRIQLHCADSSVQMPCSANAYSAQPSSAAWLTLDAPIGLCPQVILGCDPRAASTVAVQTRLSNT